MLPAIALFAGVYWAYKSVVTSAPDVRGLGAGFLLAALGAAEGEALHRALLAASMGGYAPGVGVLTLSCVAAYLSIAWAGRDIQRRWDLGGPTVSFGAMSAALLLATYIAIGQSLFQVCPARGGSVAPGGEGGSRWAGAKHALR